MIHLFYLNNHLDEDENLLLEFVKIKDRFQHKNNVAVIPNYLSHYCSHDHVISDLFSRKIIQRDTAIDLELISKQKIDNLFLLNIDYLNPTVCQTLINIKSKKSQIIAISYNWADFLLEIRTEISNCRSFGLSDKQIEIILMLEKNLDYRTVVNCMNGYTYHDTANIKKINHIDDIFQFITI